MPRKPTVKSGGCPKNPVGRPEKHIDWELFEKLCGIQCTQSEIASMLKIDHETLANRVVKQYNDNYSNTYKRLSESGKCSIRRYQFSHMPKNASMCMYLGKVYLGQKETPDNLTAPNDQANELISAYQKQLAEAWKEIEHLKSNGNVSQTTNKQVGSQ
jgi:hypothetical protein